FSEMGDRVQFTAKERAGVTYIRPLRTLLQQIQSHQSGSAFLASGSSTAKSAMVRQQADIEKTIHAIDLVDQQLGGSLQTTEKWSALKDSWWDLKGRTFQLSLAENAGAHEQLMGAIASLIKTAGDSSNLILDPDLDSYYLMSNVVVLLP